jgi:rubrerythrin
MSTRFDYKRVCQICGYTEPDMGVVSCPVCMDGTTTGMMKLIKVKK